MKKKGLLIIGALALIFAACEYTDIVEDDGSNVVIGESVSFAEEIEPIFAELSCTNCHPAMKKPDLTTGKAYQSIIELGLVNTSSPSESGIHTVPSPDGKHAAKYTASQAKLILAWIEQGAENN